MYFTTTKHKPTKRQVILKLYSSWSEVIKQESEYAYSHCVWLVTPTIQQVKFPIKLLQNPGNPYPKSRLSTVIKTNSKYSTVILCYLVHDHHRTTSGVSLLLMLLLSFLLFSHSFLHFLPILESQPDVHRILSGPLQKFPRASLWR